MSGNQIVEMERRKNQGDISNKQCTTVVNNDVHGELVNKSNQTGTRLANDMIQSTQTSIFLTLHLVCPGEVGVC